MNLVVRRSEALAVGFDSEDKWGEDTLVTRGAPAPRRADPLRARRDRLPLAQTALESRICASSTAGPATAARTLARSAVTPFARPTSPRRRSSSSSPPVRSRRGPARRLWGAGFAIYALACIAAGADRSPARWVRVSGAIAATHIVYGVGVPGRAGGGPAGTPLMATPATAPPPTRRAPPAERPSGEKSRGRRSRPAAPPALAPSDSSRSRSSRSSSPSTSWSATTSSSTSTWSTSTPSLASPTPISSGGTSRRSSRRSASSGRRSRRSSSCRSR